MIVVAIIAIIAAMAIPRLSAARVIAHESNAVATMRTIATAEAQTVASSSIDSNGDGAGEYAYFAEMAGLKPARVNAGGATAAGVPGIDELRPNSLVVGMGNVSASCVQRSGYLFQIWLPGAAVAGAVPGIAEDPTGGKAAGPFPDSDNCATMWCAYAWPLSRGNSGDMVYFINNSGQMLQMSNRGAVKYSGLAGGPPFDAAFSAANDMGSGIAINGLVANDTNLWTPFSN
jgi:hypothetical protein